MDKIYIEDKTLFLDYLESKRVDLIKPYILETAPSVIESLSRLLVQKYKENSKQYLVSGSFDYDNPYNVKGTKGYIYLKNLDININNSKILFEENSFRHNKLNQKLPKTTDFDVLLIQGMPDLLFELYGARINKLFGDVLNVGDENFNNYKRLYEAIFRLIKDSSTHEYELCHDTINELGKELYLIKRR